jgi:hypothetical protein
MPATYRKIMNQPNPTVKLRGAGLDQICESNEFFF